MIRLGLWIATTLLVFDQATKWWVLNYVLTGSDTMLSPRPFP